MEKLDRVRFLVIALNAYTKDYEQGNPKITDEEWDNMYFELKSLEEETGLILSNSPTQTITYDVVNALSKVEHNHKMLSLEKTKSLDELNSFIGKKEAVIMCKMDGLTCSVTYKNGELVAAETRGNGLVGEDILHNARVLSSIPKKIPYKDELVIVTPATEKYVALQDSSMDDISWIKKEAFIMREEGSGTRKEAEKQLQNAGIAVEALNVIASIGNQEAIKKSVRQGMGISVMSRLAAEDEIESGKLLIFPIPGASEGRDINLVYNKNYELSRSAERFIRVVKEVYKVKANPFLKVVTGVINYANPVYWIKKVLFGGTLNVALNKMSLIVIDIVGAETIRVYSKRLFSEETLLLDDVIKEEIKEMEELE